MQRMYRTVFSHVVAWLRSGMRVQPTSLDVEAVQIMELVRIHWLSVPIAET
jgi:hypothetical protein